MNKSELNMSNVLTLGGIVAIAITGSYAIRAYLDLLRIKKIKEELSNGN